MMTNSNIDTVNKSITTDNQQICDAPLDRIESDDILGRYEFAENLLNLIENSFSEYSKVIGLYGEWGTGKTTILNHIRSRIIKRNESADYPFEIISINPWRTKEESVWTMQLIRSINKFLTHTGGSYELKRVLKKYAQLVSAIPTPGLNLVGTAMGMIGEGSEDVETYRRKIDQMMKKKAIHFLIMIDDIDRLMDDQIRDVFRMIRCIVDFPYTVFVIACDPKHVAHALIGSKSITSLGSDAERFQYGREYIDKIVQHPIDIPKVRKRGRLKYISRALLDLLHAQGIELESFEKEEIFSTHIHLICELCNTPRKMNRYFPALKFALASLKCEVNRADLIAYECFRINIPELLFALFKSPELIYDVYMDRYDKKRRVDIQSRVAGKEIKDNEILFPHEVIEILKYKTESQQNLIKESLKCIYPWYKVIRPENSLDETRLNIEKRLCIRKFRDRYFSSNISEYEISNSDFERITSTSTDQEFKQWLNVFINKNNILDFLSMCKIYLRNLKESMKAEIINYLISTYWKDEEEFDTIHTEDIEPELETIKLFEIRDVILKLLSNDTKKLLMEYNQLLDKYGFCILIFRLYLHIENIIISNGSEETEQELENIRNNIVNMIIKNYIQLDNYRNRQYIDRDIFNVLAKYGNKNKIKKEFKKKLSREKNFAFTVLKVYEHFQEFEIESYDNMVKYDLIDPKYVFEALLDILGDELKSIKEIKDIYMLERKGMKRDEILARQFAAIHNTRKKKISSESN